MDEGEARGAVAAEEEAAGIICSLRAGNLAGWTPPWRGPPSSEAHGGGTTKEEEKAWPAVTRGKRSRASRRRSPSGSGSAAKGRWARGSPASPLDYSGGSGASTSGGEDGAFCSLPATSATARAHPVPAAAVTPASSSAKVGGLVGGRRPSTLPVPVTPPRPAGQRSRKKMRLPEVQLLVRSLAAENDGLREEMQSLRRACTVLSEENGTLETRLEHSSSSSKRKRIGSEEEQRRQTSGFVLPDLNIPAQDVADGLMPAAAP